jgi:hypothetical protein
MKGRITALVVTAALALGGGAVATMPAGAASQPQAHAACSYAKIGGQRRCIAAGQYCARSHQRDYLRYGYSCSKRDRNGSYHLVRR